MPLNGIRNRQSEALPVAQPPGRSNQRLSPRALLDVSVSYDILEGTRLTVGADNVLGTYPDRATSIVKNLGYKYPLVRAYDTDGGRWCIRATQKF